MSAPFTSTTKSLMADRRLESRPCLRQNYAGFARNFLLDLPERQRHESPVSEGEAHHHLFAILIGVTQQDVSSSSFRVITCVDQFERHPPFAPRTSSPKP